MPEGPSAERANTASRGGGFDDSSGHPYNSRDGTGEHTGDPDITSRVDRLPEQLSGALERRSGDYSNHGPPARNTFPYNRFTCPGLVGMAYQALKHLGGAVFYTLGYIMNRPETLGIPGYIFQALLELKRFLEDIAISHMIRSQGLVNVIGADGLIPNDHPDEAGRLDALRVSYTSRFQSHGQLVDLDIAIRHGEGAALFTGLNHPEKIGRYNTLQLLYMARFDYLGELADLRMAIECGTWVVTHLLDNHPEKPEWLDKLSAFHALRFQYLGEPADLNKAIECTAEAVVLTPDNHPDKPEQLSRLESLYAARFQRLDELMDLSKAIDCGARAISLTPSGYPDKSSMLGNLGSSYLSRFRRLGELSDINKSIECGAEAITLVHDGHPNRADLLTNLGSSCMARFNRLGKLPDLNKSIECRVEAVSLTPDNHADKPAILSCLANSYLSRFQCLDKLGDLDKAIKTEEGASVLLPDGHPDQPGILGNLANSYLSRFRRLGELPDLSESITYGTKAAMAIPDDHPYKPSILGNLGSSYLARFRRLGELSDINKSIECGAEAVKLSPNDHPNKADMLGNLRNSYVARFHRLGELLDLSKSIECGTEAIAIIPNGHPNKAVLHSRQGDSYLSLFHRLGEPMDLSKSIECGTRAIALTHGSHPDRPSILDHLGSSYMARFEYLGELLDLNKSIKHRAEAVALTPDDHPDKLTRLGNLGSSHRARFELLGELPDLNRAIDWGTKAALLTPDGHANKHSMFTNLGRSYMTRYERLGELRDLSKSLEYAEIAASLTSNNHPDQPKKLNELGMLYGIRFVRLGELPDLNKAIEYGAQAVSLTPDDHAEKSGRLSNIGISYLTRFEQAGELLDLSKAIEYGVAGVSLTPDSHPGKPGQFIVLGDSYAARFKHLGQPPDLDSAIMCYTAAAQSFTGPPGVRLFACRQWAQLARRQVSSSSYPAYQQAVRLLPQLIWIGTTVNRRYSLLKDLGDFITEAASYAISMDNLSLALEWLESGRSVVWGQIAQLRTPFELLSTHDPALASRLKEVGQMLEDAGSRSSPVSSVGSEETSLEAEANVRVELAIEWDKLLSTARSIPGFEDFLCPLKLSTLLNVAKLHPVVVINAHESRCDALILLPGHRKLTHVPLVNFSVATALAARKHMALLAGHRGFVRANKWTPASLESVLRSLWLGIVQPVLDCLGYNHKLPVDKLPRLTWCPTGITSLLPLHAAGSYDQFQLNTFDFVISSYTPTISALLTSQSVTSDEYGGILVVGQEHTPGLDRLPCIRDELRVIAEYSRSGYYRQLENDQATVDQVLDAMDQSSWVHMACHGTQNPVDPTQSAFHLHDGHLTLATISKRRFHNKGLAFLSACQTATGAEEVPDEAVHLAAGLLMAGYPSVIGTMWSIIDEDGPEVADRVYAVLLKNGTMDHTNSAMALHQAVACLRAKVGEKEISRWAPFIHIGS